ncbi:MAG: hypothetical protein EXR05_08865 [Acetobacteraceae bacterium]|nr:hypothetical protein [Acetobacteraceae bacterium]MSP29020.1 hypothetical protein [Acetobacteraceae bacterium]
MADPIQMAPRWETMGQYGQNIPTECWLMCFQMMYSHQSWDKSGIESTSNAVEVDVASAKKTTGLLTRGYMQSANALSLHA